ncbi:hypothetical protein AAVH_11772 [Aphelenchoides avenae]|nr:hypothetical protein AAVH_11772 [Aphelenchus avenae]
MTRISIAAILLAVAYDQVSGASTRSRHGRRQRSGDDACLTHCDAQFRGDFQDSFGKSYDDGYFDFPIDPLLSSSTQIFDTFCRLVVEKNNCYKEECSVTKVPSSPHTYICIEQRTAFEESLPCLNKTSARMKCHSACSKGARQSVDVAEELRETRGLSVPEVQSYHEQNLRCRFQACLLQCRDGLVDQLCDDSEKELTQRTVHRYYEADLSSDRDDFMTNGKRKLFPKFCQRWVDVQSEVEAQTDSDDYETSFNRTMECLRETARVAVERSLAA